MYCPNCGEKIADNETHYRYPTAKIRAYSCSPKAERSEVLQGCPPSANCSAGAGADAQPNSLISSPVPREKAVRRRTTVEKALDCIELWMKSDVELFKDAPFKKNLEHRLRTLRALRRLLSKPSDAGHCKGQRALARNEKGQP